MGMKIHHGPDGTYKTSGAIKDDILPVIKSGRTLVTNIRGFSREKALKVLGKKFVHKDFKVIFVDTEQQPGRDKLARFFHWAPKGAFFVIDEVQRIFKPKWNAKDIQELNYIGGPEQAAIDDRPEDMDTAWDMQRHYNWDFVFTTTSITKVRAEMKDMAKVAIRHYNLGIWRFYKTVEHATDSRGTSKSSQGTVKFFNWVPKKIFALYSSTKTGAFTNSEPRTPFYKDPKILGLLVVLACLWSYILSKPAPKVLGGHRQDDAISVQQGSEPIQKVSSSSNSDAVQRGNSQVVNNDSVTLSNQLIDKNPHLDPYHAILKNAYITGSSFSIREKNYAFNSDIDGVEYSFNSMDLRELGYYVKPIKPCKAKLIFNGRSSFVYCSYKNSFLDVIADNQQATERVPTGTQRTAS
ncbi:zonular occludens toxin domain-containing protein [Pseudoalteromonas denitrificans]|uniref:Zona occludens toxin n=1 Tax=Pseudoalteromonas denitrificans DSM 6059 TaxID=1123010 RepID=A0A1I1ETP2_9GAMM|nr:zonular occludens toxin domain-containing protein [Pseudoalteromonas denitrificans]SFB90519.1 zona occludens toxin [Pseudoalteromonas denitrificans DSM 6059]